MRISELLDKLNDVRMFIGEIDATVQINDTGDEG